MGYKFAFSGQYDVEMSSFELRIQLKSSRETQNFHSAWNIVVSLGGGWEMENEYIQWVGTNATKC